MDWIWLVGPFLTRVCDKTAVAICLQNRMLKSECVCMCVQVCSLSGNEVFKSVSIFANSTIRVNILVCLVAYVQKDMPG